MGRVSTDRDFISQLDDRLAADLSANEFDHRTEHSIELQVQMLQICQPDHAFKIVPIICPDVCGPTGTAPGDGSRPDLGELADALGQLVAEDSARTVLIAGADMSHVGLAFGDEEHATPEFLADVERHDRSVLERLEADDSAGLLSTVRASENATRICSIGCMYVVRRALRGRACHLLAYHQAVDGESDTNVTCAAAVIL